jgi:hypothetical protein
MTERWKVGPLQRQSPKLPIAQAGFFQVEIALDVPPDLVGDLAVAKQGVDELAFRRDQFPRQGGAGRGDVRRVGVE